MSASASAVQGRSLSSSKVVIYNFENLVLVKNLHYFNVTCPDGPCVAQYRILLGGWSAGTSTIGPDTVEQIERVVQSTCS
jgi:hypothetical protein